MYRIQSTALDLFEARSFDDVTVEEIAEASETSPSSIYRYFGTKEQIVLWDEYDPSMDALLHEALADVVPLEGLRRMFAAMAASLQPESERRVVRRLRLALTSPSLEQATIASTYTIAEQVERALAVRLGRPVADLEVQVFAHAFVGGLLGMFHHWQGTDYEAPFADILSRTFEIFEEGLDIVSGPGAPAAPPAAPAN
jgi:AcrR family transcriptional regulator